MQETKIQSLEGRTFKLALQLTIDLGELKALCNTLQALVAKEDTSGTSGGMIGVLITRLIKRAIDLKFEEKLLVESSCLAPQEQQEPSINSFKANIVKGMLITFIEHPRGFPGFFDIVSGIASAGLGMGSIRIPESDIQTKLVELQKFYPDSSLTRRAQISLMKQFFTPETIAQFPNIRIGLYSLLSGCALLPFYAASLRLNSKSSGDPEKDLEIAAELVTTRFSGNSERLNKFLAQNLFRVLFEELFTHESTVFSLFNS